MTAAQNTIDPMDEASLLAGLEGVAPQQSGSVWMRPVEAIAAALLVGIIALLLVGVISRYVFSLPIVWIDEVASISFLWLAMLGSAMAVDRSEHLRLTLFVGMLPERVQGLANTLALLLMALFLGVMLRPAYEYAIEESYITSAALNIPMSFRAAALPVGVGLMLILAVINALKGSTLRQVAISVVVIAVATLLLWLVGPGLKQIGNWNIPIFLVGFVALFLVLGVPIAFCFGLGTLAFLTFTTSVPVFVMIGRMDEGMSSIILLSVPIFVLLGCVLDATGMGKAIVEVLASLLGHVRAGMSYVLLGSMFLVSGISGSKVSDMATVAPALFPEMKRRGHKPPEMIALLATGAAMAETVPPSIVLIVLGSAAGVSIAGLFTSGFAIAMVLLLVLAILARWKARHESMASVRRAPLSVIKKAFLVAAPALVLPFLIRTAVGEGIATATEVSTIAVLYAMIIGATLYGGISLKKLYEMLVETAALSGAILMILGAASAMAWALTQTGFAAQLVQAVQGLPGGWLTFMGVTILIFMVLGCVLEGLPAIVLMAPIMFPVARSLGINDIHYSMVVVTAMNIGLMTPPIGIGFYIACKIGNVSPDEAMKAIWPYIGALMIGLLVIAAVPYFSTAFL
ncbi:Putative TRAP-type C4-dicarboxylate transport system, fusion of small and large permease proteins (DctQ/dctM domains) [Neorhizobium galegae bv. officinalis bv. officinalis str. HAMBI 1141]|uniref:Putative TRAP-type C4-dicarboxylate transport system, fusion of small and large permease proteins (DctQ/dctM domains) n=2 Tax=Neorhizobium galegae TaxID=399 RepID=A0A068TCE4_NEOGA|nr:Putative TRAP-type C4-dicarboxylate transport system, fusion of small and large permease proteins (DctQ/dctM domains) [Neorhizobium galegae bv. officinalis bv. officinalis str. HAMBI 1141]